MARRSPGFGAGEVMGGGGIVRGIVRHPLRSASLVALTPLDLVQFTAEAAQAARAAEAAEEL